MSTWKIAIDEGDVLVIITFVSAKQIYNGKVNLFNKIELHIPFAILFSIPFRLLVMSLLEYAFFGFYRLTPLLVSFTFQFVECLQQDKGDHKHNQTQQL